MNHLIRTFGARLLVLSILTLGWMSSTALAQEARNYQAEGQILELSNQSINIDDLDFKLSATVKVSIPGRNNARLSHLKKGDYVGVKMIKYQGNMLVDTIYFLR